MANCSCTIVGCPTCDPYGLRGGHYTIPPPTVHLDGIRVLRPEEAFDLGFHHERCKCRKCEAAQRESAE